MTNLNDLEVPKSDPKPLPTTEERIAYAEQITVAYENVLDLLLIADAHLHGIRQVMTADQQPDSDVWDVRKIEVELAQTREKIAQKSARWDGYLRARSGL